MKDETAAALVAAGRLLQSKTWPNGRKTIQCQPGEKYPQAVRRVIEGLPDDEKNTLRELTQWVRSYEQYEQHEQESRG
jgi:hypothetical protein